MRSVGIIDYRAGNIRSIENAFSHLGVRVQIVKSSEQFGELSHLVLPGVGAFGYCAEMLHASGMLGAIEEWCIAQARPLLGICVGMQLMARMGYELGEHDGLDWIGGDVVPMAANPPLVRIPHVGWNEVTFDVSFGDTPKGTAADFYFDHSYALYKPTKGEVVGTCVHGEPFVAIAQKQNIVAAQFHPEKSQDAGLRFLRNFLALEAKC
jgi:imidazole glycerol-phosphate synthase subunit HisH